MYFYNLFSIIVLHKKSIEEAKQNHRKILTSFYIANNDFITSYLTNEGWLQDDMTEISLSNILAVFVSRFPRSIILIATRSKNIIMLSNLII